MQKLCIHCKKYPVTEVNVAGRKKYLCQGCQYLSGRFLVGEKLVAESEDKKGQKRHLVVGALIFSKDKKSILLNKRRVWPYCYDIPAGHIKLDETPKTAIAREVLEETGLSIAKSQLLDHEIFNDDSCRYGCDTHEWFLFKCSVRDYNVLPNSESEDVTWHPIAQLKAMNFLPATKYFIKSHVLENNHRKSSRKNSIEKITDAGGDMDAVLAERREEMLYHLSTALFKLDAIENILQMAVKEITSSMNCYSSSIYLYNPRNQMLEVGAYANSEGASSPHDLHQFKLGAGITGSAAFKRKIIAISDISTEKEYIGKATDKGAIIAIPILSKDKLVGTLSVSYNDPKIFTEAEAQYLSILGSMIGLAIENNRLYKRLDNKVQNLSMLFGVTSISGRQTKNTIQQMVDTVPALLESEKCHFLIFNPLKNNFGSFALSNDEGSLLPEIPLGQGVTSKIFLSQKPMFVNDADANSDIILKYRKIFNIKSQLSIPVQAGAKSIGVLHVINKVNGDFNDEDLKLASIVASRIGMKIENTNSIAEIKSEKDFLDSVIENSDEGILIINSKGDITVWNRFLEKVFGIKRSEVIGKSGLNLAKKIGAQELYWKVVRSMQKNHYLEKEITAASGERILLGINIFFVGDEHEQSAVVMARDITKERNLLQAKNDLISTATHELRTPLTAVKGYLSMAQNPNAGELSEKQMKYLGKASESTERLVNLIEDLLGALRIDENRVVLDKQVFKAGPMINEAIANLQSKAKAKDIRIYNKSAYDTFVFADPIKSKQIVENLIDNAIKYTHDHGKIFIATEKSIHDIKISIKDTGVGINKADAEKVFERFYRISNPLSISAGGTGLGLYIAKNLVEQQGGRIWLDSEIGRGTTFNFTLPTTNIIK